MKMRDRIRKGLLNRRGVEFAYLFSFVGFVVYSKRRANHVFFFVLGERVKERERSQFHFHRYLTTNVFDTATHCVSSNSPSVINFS